MQVNLKKLQVLLIDAATIQRDILQMYNCLADIQRIERGSSCRGDKPAQIAVWIGDASNDHHQFIDTSLVQVMIEAHVRDSSSITKERT